MKLSKRQLKRIIREEYSRLKRRGLIRETFEVGGSPDDIPAYQEIIFDVLERFEFGAPFETFAAIVQRDLGRYDMRNMHAALEELVESGEIVGPGGPANFYRLPDQIDPYAPA